MKWIGRKREKGRLSHQPTLNYPKMVKTGHF
jgi:hypothetical protein